MADIELGGQKISPVVLIVGAGAVLLLVILSRGGGGGVTPTSAGSMAEEVNQALQTAQEKQASALEEQAAKLEQQLALQQTKTDAAVAAAKATDTKLTESTSGLSAALAKLSDLVAKLAEQITSGAKNVAARKFPLDPNYNGPSPDESAIKAWATGIGLPWVWGREFVNKFGRLPDSIPQLEQWRNIVGQQNSNGAWCISGECI